MVYSTRRFDVCLSVCHFVLVVFSPFSIAITSLGEERANLSAFRTFVRFVLVWICRFPLPLGVWEGLRFVIVALPGLSSYLFLVVDVERWLFYKGTCHVIVLAKLHDMYLYKTDNFFHINHYLKSVSKVAISYTGFTVYQTIIGVVFSTHICIWHERKL